MVRCNDNSIYSGYAVNPYKRELVHNSGRGAKYTRARLPVKLEYFEEFSNKKDALQRERELKKYTHKEKEKIINGGKKMANEDKKDFNKKMNDSKNMPKIVELDDAAAEKWGGKRMIIAPPIYYDKIMKKIPKGQLTTTDKIRKYVAKENNVDITCPLTAGIFINICAWASYQRTEDITPYWRILKSNGELNPKYPEGIELQKKKLEEEGHIIIEKGKKNKKYFVKDFEEKLFDLNF